jgi:cephalosporin hydroxylase
VGGRRAMVILDSAHLTDHVRKELEMYAPIVSPGCYLIVNDTYFEEMGKTSRLENPARAARDFLRDNGDFEIDATLPRFHESCAPSGFLRRVEKKGADIRSRAGD